jgi:HSP20 family molecular chaperone IbpA
MPSRHRGRSEASALSGWPTPGLPEWWRSWFGFESEAPWLRMEEFEDGNDLEITTELPDIDPDKEVEAMYRNGILEVRVLFPPAAGPAPTKVPVASG